MINHNNFTALNICLNDEDKLEIVLSTLKNQFRGKIVTIDGGSNDGSRKIAKKYADEVLEVKAGIHRQLNAGIKVSETDFIILVESDHYYPENFFDDLIDEYFASKLEVIQATLSLEKTNTIWEYFHMLFLKLHYIKTTKRYDISAPSIWPRKLFQDCLDNMIKSQGYSFDTSLSIYLEQKMVNTGIGKTLAYEDTSINFSRFWARHINYGKGDYELLMRNKHIWGLKRKTKSITNVARRYWFEYPYKTLKNGINPLLIFYLYLIGLIRYFGLLKSILKVKK